MKKNRILIFSTIFFIDQLIKFIINSNIDLGSEVYVIPNFFYLSNVLNSGGAFSIFNNSQLLLAIIGLIVLFYVFKHINKKKMDDFENISYSILIGGIISNLFDRMIIHGVRDYIGIKIFNYYYPIFNFADICIVVSVVLILISEIRSNDYGNRSK